MSFETRMSINEENDIFAFKLKQRGTIYLLDTRIANVCSQYENMAGSH